MIVTVDIGNSRVKCAQWMTEVIVARNVAAYDRDGAADTLDSQVFDRLFEAVQKPARVLAVCVGHQDLRAALTDWVQKHWQMEVEFLNTSERHGDVVNAYADPAKHGADRWAALVAAHQLEPESPVCVISAGTAITFDLLEKGGQHLGGYILPSYMSMHTALLSDTADLKSFSHDINEAGVSKADVGKAKDGPAVESEQHMQYHASEKNSLTEVGPVSTRISSQVPTSTRDAIDQGLHKMLQAGVRELCQSAQARLGQSMKVIVTGGFAEKILTYQDMPEMLHKPDLVMQGLYRIMHQQSK